ncbi:NAD(P)H-hydrate dehydratase [Sphingomonas sp. R647]|uniref:NAD(P)H-hydrate dehydratase n=1 Tax=Sphingomonas sp. R647 TaxID=2875233 RepID=UPI001CD744E3|nr:NAD(P)H-hydrate dehydratase [Sphingomonas sp. R647]MCA1200188.1 NAD(P)H-hydrate dehydratase [Sphingomonas sp. R647]
MIQLNAEWVARHPLPFPGEGTDKNDRGRLLVAGGSSTVPGALLLTGEAALRAGAGKVQLATVATVATGLGLAFPEAAVFALDCNADGELAASSALEIMRLMKLNDAAVLGPGTSATSDGPGILAKITQSRAGIPLLLDAAMLHALPQVDDELRAYSGPKILTPHPGEMAALMDCSPDDICCELAEAAAARFSATVVLKSSCTWISTPGQPSLRYDNGSPGLATAGSGDVLAGIIGGLLARHVAPHEAAAWGVWAHGEAGRTLAARTGPLGFLARDIVGLIPAMLRDSS